MMEFLAELLQINEAKPVRAWQGQLKKIDELLGWMYEKGILTATEMKQKDTIFNQYYRYYNDGDFPRGIAGKVSKYQSADKIELALEEYLETFVKSMLSKYLPKVDRKEFRLDKLISNLNTVIGVAEQDDAHGLIEYWLDTVKMTDRTKLEELLQKLKKSYDAANKAIPGSKNYVLSYRKSNLEKEDKWTPELDKKYEEMRNDIAPILELLKDMKKSVMKLKGIEQ